MRPSPYLRPQTRRQDQNLLIALMLIERREGQFQITERGCKCRYPYVQAAASPVAGTEDAPLGVRVDNTKLINMNGYPNSLQAPPGIVADAAAGARGRDLFRNNCTACHNVDQSKPVPAFTVPMATIFPGDNPVVLLAMRTPPLNPILNMLGNALTWSSS